MMSYLAVSQWKAAALHPPDLKAICPWEGFTDAYRDLMRPGGIREDGFVRLWGRALRQVRQWYRLTEQQPRHLLRDEWWRALVPPLENITVPALICGSFSDNNLHSRGSFRGWEGISSTARFLYTHRGGKWATFYSPEALPDRRWACHRAAIRGWSHHLRHAFAGHLLGMGNHSRYRNNRPDGPKALARWP